MKIDQTHIDQIRTAFQNVQSKQDLLQLMNEVKPLIYGEKTVPFQLKQLTWYSSPKLTKNKYTTFKIKKKSGAERTIHAPINGLKVIQKTLSFILQCIYEPHHAATGFVRHKSIVDNAKIHIASKYVYNIDLKDFFPSIDQARVWKCLQLKPFYLANKFENETSDSLISHINMTNEEQPIFIVKNGWLTIDKKTNKIKDRSQILVNMIAAICCTEMEVERKDKLTGTWTKVKRNVLPQGAPTSPILSNVICQRMDYLLSAVAKRFGLKYSRYADDITFSSMHNVYQKDSVFLRELHRIIADQGFHVKESKTRLQKEGYRQVVTGLIVNDKENVRQRYIKQLRMWLYYWENYGYDRAQGFFLQQYLADKEGIIKGKPDMVNVIDGKLNYLKMIKGEENELYMKLKNRFDLLTSKHSFINNLLETWEQSGIDNAMDLFYFKKD